MEQIREGAIFSLPIRWTWEAWRFAWFDACSGLSAKEFAKQGFWIQLSFLVAVH